MPGTLRRIVATLPEKPRLVVTLRYQEDLDPSRDRRASGYAAQHGQEPSAAFAHDFERESHTIFGREYEYDLEEN